MFCPACAHNNPDAAMTCSQCGGAMPRPMQMPGAPPAPYPGPPVGSPYGMPPYGMPPYGMPPYGAPYPYGHGGPYGPPMPYAQPVRTSGMAIAGFVLSFLGGVLGLVFSILGYNESKNSNGMIGGQGLALAGIIISIVMMIFWLLISVAAN